MLSPASNAAESQTASTKYVLSRSTQLHLFTPLPEIRRPCCLCCNRVLHFLPLCHSGNPLFHFFSLLILPYPPRQGSHRWENHDTVTTNHGANAAFTMPRYICTAPSAYQAAPSAQGTLASAGHAHLALAVRINGSPASRVVSRCAGRGFPADNIFSTDGRSASTGISL